MKYVSTRGDAPVLGFCDTILAGLARDGGLYVPQTWPQISPETIASFAGKPYTKVAQTVLWPFVDGEIEREDFNTIIDEAYATFSHPAVAPLIQTGDNTFVLELFHGPTLAFKDVAMQLLARLMDHVLNQRREKVTIVGATSGDTGGAAIEAFRSRDNADIFIFFPKGRVSDVQRLQMTGVHDANVHAVAIEGDFDDCQALVKAMFNHHAFRDSHALSGVNSINWGRIMAQIVYYFTAAAALGAPHRPVSFSVPTGNFGDIFAGYVAKKMGLPVERLVIATNSNDILARTIETGRYEKGGVEITSSPSMDIQVSSNFERLLFEASGRDADYVNRCMSSLNQSGAFSLGDQVWSAIKDEFGAGRCDDRTVAKTIEQTLAETGYLLDTHTAVGLEVATHVAEKSAPMVVLATAHPAKFPDAVEAASGIRPALPARCGDLMDAQERFTVLANNLQSVEDYISRSTRAAKTETA